MFGIEEKLKDEKGDFLWKIDGGSEPDPKFSNLEKHSSSEDFEPEDDYAEGENSEEEEEELGLSEIRGFLEDDRSSVKSPLDLNVPELDVAFRMDGSDEGDDRSSVPTQIFS